MHLKKVLIFYSSKVHTDKVVYKSRNFMRIIKETKSATMNTFRIFYFLFKSFVKVELSYVFTINLFTIAENCMET